ncbi:MAG: type transport system ATP-binding protein [Blastocatellia bacterium]
MNENTAVRVKNVSKRYGRTLALDKVSLEIGSGEVFGLLGRNGAGKTSLIEILEGLRTVDEGKVSVLGFDPTRQLDSIKQRIGIQLQSSSFFHKLRVVEIMQQFRSYYKRQGDLDELLALVALNEKRNSFISDLSLGQKQRLALALALVNDPDMVFLDEPTAGLDAQVRRQLWHTIGQMKQSGKTILLTTHYIEEAELLCDRVCIMDAGRTIALDTPANLIARGQQRLARICFTTIKPLALDQFGGASPTLLSLNGNARYALEVENTGPAIVQLVSAIAQQNNELLELQINRATLEDVFLELTGKEIGQ